MGHLNSSESYLRISKTNPLIKIFNNFLIDSALPSNINYFWNFGSL
jgi:quinol-cytochrome oxidoreductase complex cytochrome b subunit